MKKIVAIAALCFILLVNYCQAQTEIKARKAKKYIDKEVMATGTVDQITKINYMVYLNIDGKYPNSKLTAVIFPKDTANFRDIDSFYGKKVVITGTVKEFKNAPEIVLEEGKQIKIK